LPPHLPLLRDVCVMRKELARADQRGITLLLG
jgi:hypothetical protein